MRKITAGGRRIAITIALALTAGFLVMPAAVQAQSDVSLDVADTFIEFSGKTSPNAFVTIKDSDTVIATVQAGTDGNYAKTVPAQIPGIHTLSLYAKDLGGLVGDSAVLSAHIPNGQTTSVYAFLPTTIALSSSSLQPGAPLFAHGETIPGGAVSLHVDQNLTYNAVADQTGTWSVQLNASQLTAGSHSIYGYAVDDSGSQSYPTSPRFFTTLSPSLAPIQHSGFSPQFPSARTATPKIPTITIPANTSTASVFDITIAGLSDPENQIEVWRGNRLMGSIFADKAGGWTMLLRLQNGSNSLRARACHGMVCSDFSSPVVVTYAGSEALGNAFKIVLNTYRFVTRRGSSITVIVTSANGVRPLQYNVQWGDGMEQKINSSSRTMTISHAYRRAGNYSGKIQVTDDTGATVTAYFTVQQSSGVSWIFIMIAWIILLLGIISLIILRHRIRTIIVSLRAIIDRQKRHHDA